MKPGLTWNKALGAGIGGIVLGTFGPALLGLLNFVHPIAGAINPLLGTFVGVLVGVVTWLTPKNAEPTKTKLHTPPPG